MLEVDRDRLGRAIHAAKRVGGPWGPPCGRPKAGREASHYPEDWVVIEYDDQSEGDFACECSSMAGHLMELMTDE